MISRANHAVISFLCSPQSYGLFSESIKKWLIKILNTMPLLDPKAINHKPQKLSTQIISKETCSAMESLLSSPGNSNSPVKTTHDLLDVLYKSFYAEVDPEVVSKEVTNETLLVEKVESLEKELKLLKEIVLSRDAVDSYVSASNMAHNVEAGMLLFRNKITQDVLTQVYSNLLWPENIYSKTIRNPQDFIDYRSGWHDVSNRSQKIVVWDFDLTSTESSAKIPQDNPTEIIPNNESKVYENVLLTGTDAAVQEIIEPVEEIVEPAEEIVEPVEEIVAPVEEIIEPVEEIIILKKLDNVTSSVAAGTEQIPVEKKKRWRPRKEKIISDIPVEKKKRWRKLKEKIISDIPVEKKKRWRKPKEKIVSDIPVEKKKRWRPRKEKIISDIPVEKKTRWRKLWQKNKPKQVPISDLSSASILSNKVKKDPIFVSRSPVPVIATDFDEFHQLLGKKLPTILEENWRENGRQQVIDCLEVLESLKPNQLIKFRSKLYEKIPLAGVPSARPVWYRAFLVDLHKCISPQGLIVFPTFHSVVAKSSINNTSSDDAKKHVGNVLNCSPAEFIEKRFKVLNGPVHPCRLTVSEEEWKTGKSKIMAWWKKLFDNPAITSSSITILEKQIIHIGKECPSQIIPLAWFIDFLDCLLNFISRLPHGSSSPSSLRENTQEIE